MVNEYWMVARSSWDEERGVHQFTKNPGLAVQIKAELEKRGLGSALKEGAQAGMRLQNGWQDSGLPWATKMNPAKMYRTDKH